MQRIRKPLARAMVNVDYLRSTRYRTSMEVGGFAADDFDFQLKRGNQAELFLVTPAPTATRRVRIDDHSISQPPHIKLIVNHRGLPIPSYSARCPLCD